MAVKSFSFASPGIFLNEIDQSQLQKSPAPVGPIIIGRSSRGPGMRPVTVASYQEFVDTFGEPFAGGDSSGDVWRSGIPAGPTYGPYAAQAWLANSPTVTYVRLLGVQSDNATGDTNNSGKAGWKYGVNTDSTVAAGAYGLYIFPDTISGSGATAQITASNAPFALGNFNGGIIGITSSAGVVKTFKFDQAKAVGDTGTLDGTDVVVGIQALTTNAQVAQQLKAAIVSTNGHTGSITVSGAGAELLLTQVYVGTDGNTVITTNSFGGGTPITKTNFTAGSLAVGSLTGSLAAVWYCNGSVPVLSGTLWNSTSSVAQNVRFIESDSSGVFTVQMSGSTNVGVDGSLKKSFNFNPTDGKFIRKVFNTNPQNSNTNSTSGLSTSDSSYYAYWLGETFENDIVNNVYAGSSKSFSSTTTQMIGIILPLSGINNRLGQEAEGDYTARTGWIIPQAGAGTVPTYNPASMTKLFRFIALDGGDWTRNNLKVTISNITPPQNAAQKFSSFDVEVRRIYDTDANKKIVESFTSCNLDPSSPNYLGRKIGTKYYSWDDAERRLLEYEEYSNNSKYIRVEINKNIDDFSQFTPFGVLGPMKYPDAVGTLTSSITGGSGIVSAWSQAFASASAGSARNGFVPSEISYKFAFPSLRTRVSSSEDSLTTYKLADWGATTTRDSTSLLYNDGVNDLLRLPSTTYMSEFTTGNASSMQYSWAFSLDDIKATGSAFVNSAWQGKFYVWQSGSKAAGTSYTATGSGGGSYVDLLNDSVNSFTTVFQGGTDGFNLLEKEPLRNTAISAGATNDNSYIYYVYRRAIDTVVDTEAVETNMLAAPGLVYEPLTQYLTQVAEQRGDALAVVDISGENVNEASYITKYENSDQNGNLVRSISVDDVVTQIRNRNLNTSYGAVYYPWVQISDSSTGKVLTIPPSIPAIGAMSYTDKIQAPWFAPAGFNRGGLSTGNAGVNVVNVVKKLNQSDRDKLYLVNINPITSFPNEGIVIFGQKTLQATPSALDRINVRRLMIYIKRGINLISRQILFEPNVEDTWNNFKDKADPFLADVKARFGLTDYKLILDDTTTTPDLIDQNIMYAKIYLKPARAIEFIAVDFFITKTGAQFPV